MDVAAKSFNICPAILSARTLSTKMLILVAHMKLLGINTVS